MHEKPARPSRRRGPLTIPPSCSRFLRGLCHGAQIESVARGQMVEAFGHTPGSRLGPRCALRVRQSGDERLGVSLGGLEPIQQRLYVDRKLWVHRRSSQGQPILRPAGFRYAGTTRPGRTDSTGGKSRATLRHDAPASAEPNTCPEVAPKYRPSDVAPSWQNA